MRHGKGIGIGVLPLARAPLRQAQGRLCSVRMTGLKGIARGDILEAIGSSPERVLKGLLIHGD
jgi:hypothetical protein